MSTSTVFLFGHGSGDLVEALLSSAATIRELHDMLAKVGIEVGDDTHIFVDDADEPLPLNPGHVLGSLKDGTRIHVTRCRRVAATVNFLEHSDEHRFPPGTSVRSVKEWAVRKFKLDPKDAAEHVLQLCNSSKRPSSDTTLQELTDNRVCAVCFDLVPEKRVEG
ncbi:hypothetical protein QBK93_11080 [Rhizobium leguminosarum]|uniref:hypothetical protein n=1 Tax=Rhizobium leguminosarum TaxID=384 RepID=UPI0024A8157D|nr:hypothetical protein [Rhizobium leguminosarum]MDI5925219.1 hypothetical protein [Rhizobium leguminosarum]